MTDKKAEPSLMPNQRFGYGHDPRENNFNVADYNKRFEDSDDPDLTSDRLDYALETVAEQHKEIKELNERVARLEGERKRLRDAISPLALLGPNTSRRDQLRAKFVLRITEEESSK